MKIKIPLIIAIFLIVNLPFFVLSKDISDREILYRDALLSLLSKDINNVLVGYYGENVNFNLFSMEILEFKRLKEGGYIFKTKLLVHTWKSALPPYGHDMITLEISSTGTFVTEFIHKDVYRLTALRH